MMKKNNLGMSLVELMIATILLALVSLIVGIVYTSGYKMVTGSKFSADRAADRVYLLKHLMRHLQQAQQINFISATQITFWDNGKTSAYYFDSAGKKLMYKPDIAAASEEIIAQTIEGVIFSISDNLGVALQYRMTKMPSGYDEYNFYVMPRLKAAYINIYRSS